MNRSLKPRVGPHGLSIKAHHLERRAITVSSAATLRWYRCVRTRRVCPLPLCLPRWRTPCDAVPASPYPQTQHTPPPPRYGGRRRSRSPGRRAGLVLFWIECLRTAWLLLLLFFLFLLFCLVCVCFLLFVVA